MWLLGKHFFCMKASLHLGGGGDGGGVESHDDFLFFFYKIP